MERKCAENGCGELPVAACRCLKGTKIFCAGHKEKHLRIKTKHEVEDICFAANEEEVQKIRRDLAKVCKALEESERNVVDFSKNLVQKILEESGKLIGRIEFERQRFVEMVKDLMNQKYLKKEDVLLASKLSISPEKSPLIVQDQLIGLIEGWFNIDVLEENQQEILNPEGASSYLQANSLSKVSKPLKNQDEDKLFYSPWDGKGQLFFIDLVTFASSKCDFGKSQKFGSVSSSCRIGQDNYFYHGGYLGAGFDKFDPNAYLLNVKQKTCAKLSSSRPRTSAGCICKDGEVYIFGGSKDNLIQNQCKINLGKECDKYTVSTNTWSSISALPNESNSTSASVYKGVIYVTGLNLKPIYMYSELSDSYSKVYELSKGTYKVLCENWLLCGNSKLYQINENSVQEFRLSNVYNGELLLNSCAFRNGSLIYFVQQQTKLLRLDTVEKKVEVIPINN